MRRGADGMDHARCPPPAGPTLLSSSGGTLEVDGRHADAAALDILQAWHAADDTGDDLILG